MIGSLPCGSRLNPNHDRLMPTSFDGCGREATHQIGDARWIAAPGRERRSVVYVLACADHVDDAKEHWRRQERRDPDRDVAVRQLRLL